MKRALIALLILVSACLTQETISHSLGGGRTIGIAGNAVAPTVTITSPTGGTVSGTITVAVTATSPVGIFSVQLLIDSMIFGTDNVPPYNFSWNTVLYPNGSHVLQAEAIDINGLTAFSNTVTVTVSNIVSTPIFFATLPTQYVSKYVSTPTVTITLGTSLNKGPNCHTETHGSCSGSVAYTDNLAGLRDAAYNWRDNADQGSQTPHFSDTGWLVQVPCQTCSGSPGILNGSGDSYDTNDAWFSWPTKCSGAHTDPGGPCGLNGANEATQWLIIDSTTPNTVGQDVCSHGLPAIDGSLNPSCPNDKGKMYRLQIKSAGTPAGAGSHDGMYAGADCTAGAVGCSPTGSECGQVANAGQGNQNACYANHVAVYNSEKDLAPGSTQSGFSGTKIPKFMHFADSGWGPNTTPTTLNPVAKHVVYEYNYDHGYDPGDSEEPNSLGAPYEDVAGTCTAWAVGQPPTISTWGTPVTVAISGSTLTRAGSGSGTTGMTWFGPNIYPGETITLGGGASGYPASQFTVASFDPTSSNTVLTVTPPPLSGSTQTLSPTLASQTATGGLQLWNPDPPVQIESAGTPGASITSIQSAETSQFAIGTAFGFSIPATATIKGVQFLTGTNLNFDDAGSVYANTVAVQLMNAGAAIGTAKGPGSHWTGLGATYTDENWGTSSDLWGASLTPAIVNSGTFGVEFKVLVDSSACTHCLVNYKGSINNFRIAVTYTLPLTAVEFSATDSLNHITSVPGFATAGCTPSTGNCQSQVNYGGTANPVVYTPGCGDDVQAGINGNADWLLLEYNYVEKIHWASSESKAISWGFSHGPIKFAHNTFQGGSEAVFSGGSAEDTSGGPTSNNQIGANYIGHNLNWRFLTGGAGGSPAPPFGCGTIDSTAGHNTCPFNWAEKNNFELKVGHKNLIYGNVIDGCWADGQTGRCVAIDERVTGGGSMAGVYDSHNLPASGTDNIRIESNWIRNGPQPGGMAPRSASPGNGGGLSFPMVGVDYINNIFSNMGDNNQFGSPGGATGGIFNFAPGGNSFPCTAVPYSGGGTSGAIAVASCQPFQGDISAKITSIVRDSNCPGTSCLVTVTTSVRMDPYLCLGVPATCVQNGQTFILVPGSAAPAGLNQGVFAMLTIPNGSNWNPDGTGGNQFTYHDSGTGASGTVCSGSTTKCTAANVITTATVASLGYKYTDITGGNPVQASNGIYMDNESYNVLNATGTGSVGTYHLDTVGTNSGCTLANCVGMAMGDPITVSGMLPSCFNHTGTVASVIDAFTFTMGGLTSCSAPSTRAGSVIDNSCTAQNFDAGIGSGVLACGANNPSCTSPATDPSDIQMRVYYKSPNATGTGNACVLSNGAGLPQYVTFQSNTVLSPNIVNIFNASLASQAYYNLFFNNVFMSNDGGVAPTNGSSDLYCTKFPNKEGTPSGHAADCWDRGTIQWYSNVMTTRASANWSVISQSGGLFPTPGGVVDYFPTQFNCPGGVGSGCVGPAGFVGGSPTITFPTGSCPNANAPYNCPLMTAPYKPSPLILANLDMSGSFYSARGANVTTMLALMTGTQYPCPTGAVCGTTTPITQVAATTTTATYTAANSFYPGEYLASIGTCSHSQFNLTGVYVATASATQFTIKGSFSNQSPVSDSCSALTGPAPD